ncbi:unnamed protein product, partial [marine sediment metagenome]
SILNNNLTGAMMSVDATEKLEGYISNVAVNFYLVGYLTANFVSWANEKDYSTANAGIWEVVNMGGDIPAGWDGACLHFHKGAFSGGIRKNGTLIDNYHRVWKHR